MKVYKLFTILQLVNYMNTL